MGKATKHSDRCPKCGRKGRLVGVEVAKPDKDRPKVGRNDPCPCGSGRKFKRCHGDRPLPSKAELDVAVARVLAS